MIAAIAMVLAAYLIGSVASAIVVCRLRGLPDPRGEGSGNPGATNVLRIGGKGPAALTLAGDVAKGVVPVLAARGLGFDLEVQAACAFAAFLGHVFPVFFRFEGGKGVATAFGVAFALAWSVGLAMGVAWLGVAAATRYSSLSSMVAGVASPVLAWWLTGEPAVISAFAAMATLLVWRHRANIARLAAGEESRIGQKSRPAAET